MGLQSVYERFLSSPNQGALAENATLQYVTTLKSFSKPQGIIFHLDDQQGNVVKKKSEKVISAVEGLTSVVVIAETTIEFLSSGGAYLPGLDNFILDRVATLPITHFVHFDHDDKITQIRLSWDQGDLLKQVEVIGARGKNWPVFGGKDQIKMITTSTNTHNEINPAPALSPRGRSRNGGDRSASPSKKFIRDPHASLNLFQQQEEERPTSGHANSVAPRESHRPAPREMSDLFAAGHEDYEPVGPGASPRKVVNEKAVAPKGAGHKKFQPSTIFSEEDLEPVKERKIYKTNPARYNHFDLGDSFDDSFQHKVEKKADDVPIRPKGGRTGQQAAQWNFADFSTPEKAGQKVRDQDVVHFSVGDEDRQQENVPVPQAGRGRPDQEVHFEMQDTGTPINRPVVHKPRKDAESHFEIKDEATPAPRRIIARTKDAAKLYHDPVFGDGEEEDERPLSAVSSNARKDLTSNWDTNNAPSNGHASKPGNVRKGFESHWDIADDNTASRPQASRARGRRDQQPQQGFWDF